ncbi:hypothetical protein SteCoe_3322 [Stentor coeruleus]|uniref:Enkurin domain-containing protein n=1 Tax=Stentor coeruleus TaxID=5963 RepID=A0A1R2CX89_9CILI|nr:hypothetical protein SteCoe_3322 [Stentor coeruleus]
MESKSKQERFSRLDTLEKIKPSAKQAGSRFKSNSPVKPRSLSPKDKKLNRSFDSKQWNKDIEKISKQEQALIKAIKELNSKYHAAKARITQSKKVIPKEDPQESKTKEIEKSLLQIDSKLRKLKEKHIPEAIKKNNK